ncbi:MAG: hypothetical protein HZC02_01960 [Candidatus Levybacteria bacterium]|nr:hypothetical protein [Candidatus Levybacteria bacterium]
MPEGLTRLKAPRDRNLVVHKNLPEGFIEPSGTDAQTYRALDGYRSAFNDAEGKQMYFCDDKCNGWIEGSPSRIPESTMSPLHPLSGRQGESICCRRCGEEIAFDGWIS